MIMKKIIYIATIGITLLTTSCDDFWTVRFLRVL